VISKIVKKGRKEAAILGLFAAVGLMQAGCAASRKAQWDDQKSIKTEASETEEEKRTALLGEGDALWAERADISKLQGALAKWEAAAAIKLDADLATKLTRGHYFLGDGHYAVAGDEENRDKHYNIGLDWAEKGLAITAPEFVKAKQSGARHPEAIKKAGKAAVPHMYWYATNLGKWAASKGFVTVLKYKDDAKATIDQVKKLDDGYFYGAAYRYLGAFEAKTASIGGSLEDSQKYFNQAKQMAPNYLGTKVLEADFLATRIKDKEKGKAQFKQLLDEVIAADPAADPEIEAENRQEQVKAKALLAKIDDLF
jgi:hypothetical protein